MRARHPYVFPGNHQAWTLREFVHLCCDNIVDAATVVQHFRNGWVEPWFIDEIKRPDLADRVLSVRRRGAVSSATVFSLLSTTNQTSDMDPVRRVANVSRQPAIVCPLCGNDNSIARVSAIYRSQTSTIASHSDAIAKPSLANVLIHNESPFRSVSASSSTVTTISSHLASLLNQPREPRWYGPWTIGMGFLAIVVAIGLGVSPIGVVGLFVAYIILMVGWFLDQDYRENEKATFSYAMKRWESAYYCAKHDIVFIPGEQETTRPTEFRSWLQQ